jgi:catechol-2,3-dioxygenase
MSTNTNGNREPSTPRISHVVLRTTRLSAMIEWYQTVFHAQVLYQSNFGAFLTYDDEHHRIALFAFPGLVEKPKRSTGLDHLAFFYPTFGDWIENYERLKAAGISPRASINHGITMSLYYRDPDDNGIELSIDNVPKSDWHEWMRNELGKNLMGASLDPDDLARRYHAGAPEAELRLFNPVASPLNPDTLRKLVE